MADMGFGGNWAGSTGDASAYSGMQTDDGIQNEGQWRRNVIDRLRDERAVEERLRLAEKAAKDAALQQALTDWHWTYRRPEEDKRIRESNIQALDKARNYPTSPTGLNFIDQLIDSAKRNPLEVYANVSPFLQGFKAIGDAINRSKGIGPYEEAHDPWMDHLDPNENAAWNMPEWMLNQEDPYGPEGAPSEDTSGFRYPTLPTDYTPAFGELERARYLEKVYNDMLANTIRPEGLDEQEFKDILSNRMALRDARAGEGADQMALENLFGSPNLGQMLLDEETADRRAGFTSNLEQAFTGEPFQAIDDSIISSILDERQGTAQGQVARFGQRGNLNPAGAESAARGITEQREGAATRLGEIGDVVQQRNIGDVQSIRDRATSAIADYDLGEDLFNVEPYRAERSQLIGEREGSLGQDIRSTLGDEPLYDVPRAITSATGTQGVVSGPQSALLDTLAERGAGSDRYRTRGLGSRGVF